MHDLAIQVIKKYYDTFNRDERESFFNLLAEDVVHDINHGGQKIEKKESQTFMDRMHRHYQEQVVELIILANENGTRAAAEFFIEGVYLKTDSNLPPARGQKYRLRCGAFFELKEDKIH